jgi:hypothetical protein
MSPAYPAAAVRLLVMPLAPSAEQQEAVQAATAAVVAAMPQGASGIALVCTPKHKGEAQALPRPGKSTTVFWLCVLTLPAPCQQAGTLQR